MKLAEALIMRADLKNKISQVKSRIIQNAKVQEGDEPTEDPAELLVKYDALMSEFEALVVRVNRTNAAAEFEAGRLIDAIAERDCLKTRISTYRDVCDKASVMRERGFGSDYKFIRCVDVTELRKQIDELSKQYREIDTKIQGINWTIDLI